MQKLSLLSQISLYVLLISYGLFALILWVLQSRILRGKAFENPDGTFLLLDKDYFGNVRSGQTSTAGPFVNPEKGKGVIKVW